MNVSMTVNGTPVSADVETRTLLVHFIRENLHLTGTHVGCETGVGAHPHVERPFLTIGEATARLVELV